MVGPPSLNRHQRQPGHTTTEPAKTTNSYTARFISFLLNCCIFLSVVAFILSTMDQFQCVRFTG